MVLPEKIDSKCVCELCKGECIQVDPVGCGCTECITGEYRPAINEEDYQLHNGEACTNPPSNYQIRNKMYE
jgi:hypothetical protein